MKTPRLLNLFRNIALLALVYFLAAKLGLRFAFVQPNATAIWAPTGISLAAFLILGKRVWPGIFLGAFSANMLTAGTAATSLGIATGNTLEGLLGAYLVGKFAHGRDCLKQARDVFKFAFCAGVLSTMASATIGVTSLTLAGFADSARYGSIWLTWWLGDMAGAVIVAPLSLSWSEKPPSPWQRKQILEVFLMFSSVFVVGFAMFGKNFFLPTHYPLEFICVIPLLWAALRFSQREAMTAILLLSCIAIWGTLHGYGPFGDYPPHESLLLLQAFTMIIALTVLVLGAVVLERKTAFEAAERAYLDLDQKVQERTRELSNTIEILEEEVRERMQVEENLYEKESWARSIIETADAAFIAMDSKGVITDWNREAELIFGWSKQEAIGRLLAETIIPEELRRRHREGLEHFLTHHEGPILNKRLELIGLHRDGRKIPVELTVWPIKRDDTYSFNAFIRDISERKKSEEESRRKNVFMYLMQVIAVASNEAKTIEVVLQLCVNEISSQLEWNLGHAYLVAATRPPTLVSTELWYMSDPERFAMFRSVTEDMISPLGESLPGKVFESGKPHWIRNVGEEAAFPRMDIARECGLRTGFAFPVLVGTEVVAVLEFFSDQEKEPDRTLLEIAGHMGVQMGRIVERNRAEKALRKAYGELELRVEERTWQLKLANEKLKQSDEAKSNFMLAASHELRTPLTAIRGYIQLLISEKGGKLNESQREFLGHLERATGRLHRLLNQLLNISKIELGQTSLKIDETKMEDLLQEEISIYKAEAEHKQISLALTVQNDLKSIRCDTDQIKEVISNLISNALKFTPAKGRVEVNAKRLDHVLEIQVRDTGIGIKAEDYSKVFDPFHHAHKTGLHGEESTGLGLALVKRIVEAHLGDIHVSSKEGGGSVFTVKLPV